MASYQLEPAAEARPAPAQLGRYQLLGQLAVGGMAEIHLARLAGEAGFAKTVVVKRLLPELVASPAFVAMFLDEGKLVARLDHPNICEVHELGRDGSEYFLAMPYLDGIPVTELISRPRDPDRLGELRVAAAIIVQACAGLHHAHELRDADGSPAGLVHRDVSPSNLFVTSAGAVKVLDFGVAKVRGASETEAGTIKGKTQYMAPEQLLGEPLDRRCDVFALGIVLYELATHQRLFKRASDYLAARAILEDPIPRADEADPAIPAAVADVIARALARDRAARFPDAAALASALADAMAAHGGLATSAQIAAVVTSTDELSAQRTRQARVIAEARSRVESVTRPLHADAAPTIVEPRARKRRTPLVIAALLFAASAAALVFVLTRDTPSADPPPGPTTASRERTDAAPTGTDAAPATPPDAGVIAPAAPPDAPPEAPRDAAEPAVQMPPDPARAAKPGTISIDSTPYARIYIDGKLLDLTPILRRPLAAGRHKIRAVLVDGRSKTFTIDVPAGRAAKPVVLTW